MTNEELADVVRAASEGDHSAWTTLVSQHRDLLRSVARGYRLSDAQVDDVVQTAWLRLVEHVDAVRDPQHITGWLVTTVRRQCLAVLRSARREQPTVSEQDEFWGEVGPADDDVLRDEDRALVRDALARLPERQRQLMLLLTWRPELDYQQVGQALSMPVGSIGPTRGRALVRLRQLLDEPRRSPVVA